MVSKKGSTLRNGVTDGVSETLDIFPEKLLRAVILFISKSLKLHTVIIDSVRILPDFLFLFGEALSTTKSGRCVSIKLETETSITHSVSIFYVYQLRQCHILTENCHVITYLCFRRSLTSYYCPVLSYHVLWCTVQLCGGYPSRTHPSVTWA